MLQRKERVREGQDSHQTMGEGESKGDSWGKATQTALRLTKGKSLGKPFRQSPLTKMSSRNLSIPPALSLWREAAHGRCGLGANIALDFKAQHLRPMVNYLLYQEVCRAHSHNCHGAHHHLKKATCTIIIPQQSTCPERSIITRK